MFELHGSQASAKCYAENIDSATISQIINMLNQPFTHNQNIAIMPDAHAGKGCVIGTTMTIDDKVCPNVVGVDLNCGMYVVEIKEKNLDLPKLDEICHHIPSGAKKWQSPQETFNLEQFRCFDSLNYTEKIQRSLGTLGGGNHFIEIDTSKDGTNYLVIHSGSRDLGLQVATIYQNIAESNKDASTPTDLAWIENKNLENYLHDVKLCQLWANKNREIMANIIITSMNLHPIHSFHTLHNYINTDEMILRKGAIAAHKEELVLIPLNMRDGSILAKGKGNKDWNFSAPHGAGRILSRSQAKETLSLDEYKKQMEGIYTTSIKKSTLDEAPGAYKPIKDIIEPIANSVDIIEKLKPIYNFKAS